MITALHLTSLCITQDNMVERCYSYIFFLSSWGLDSGPHAYETKHFRTELHPQSGINVLANYYVKKMFFES